MNRSHIGRVVRVTIPVVLLVVVTSVVTLSAKGNPTLNQILAKLDEIIAALNPPPPQAGELTLATSALFVPATQQVRCVLVNLGTEPLEVTARILEQDGSVKNDGDGTVPPGFLGYIGALGDGFRRCEITFVGTAASVRVNLIAMNLDDDEVTASVEAR